MASPTLTTTPNTPRRMQNVSRSPWTAENLPGQWHQPAPGSDQPPSSAHSHPAPSPPARSQQAGEGWIIDPKCIGTDTASRWEGSPQWPPLPAGTASAPPSVWVESSICHGHGSTTLVLLALPRRKDESFRSDSLCASCKYSIPLPGKSSSSANPLLCPCASQALFLTEEEPRFQPQ